MVEDRTGRAGGWLGGQYLLLSEYPGCGAFHRYDNTNAYASAYVSSGKAIPGITGEVLYASLCWNERFGGVRYVAAANYIMVKKIYAAQQAALAEGYTLVVNETFRPYDVQLNIAAELKKLYLADPEVKAGIDRAPLEHRLVHRQQNVHPPDRLRHGCDAGQGAPCPVSAVRRIPLCGSGGV